VRLRDIQSRQGVMHFHIKGKRDKIRFVPVHPMVLRLIGEYLEMGKHGGAVSHESLDSPLFRPVKNNRTQARATSISIRVPSIATSS
jgi:integrase/recombinase XerD